MPANISHGRSGARVLEHGGRHGGLQAACSVDTSDGTLYPGEPLDVLIAGSPRPPGAAAQLDHCHCLDSRGVGGADTAMNVAFTMIRGVLKRRRVQRAAAVAWGRSGKAVRDRYIYLIRDGGAADARDAAAGDAGTGRLVLSYSIVYQWTTSSLLISSVNMVPQGEKQANAALHLRMIAARTGPGPRHSARFAAAAARGARHVNARERPVRGVLGVYQDVVHSVSRAREAVDGNAFDRHLAAGRAGVAALRLAVVAVDHNSVLHVRQCVARVRHILDGAVVIDDGLDANAVHTVNDLVVLHRQTRHRVGRADGRSANRTDGDTVATAAGVAGEDGVGAGLHGETVVLVVDGVARDRHACVAAEVEAISVLGSAVTSTGVEGEAADSGGLGVDDAEGAVGRVLDLEALDRGRNDLVHAEEHGARDGGALLPVPSSLAVQSARATDGKIGAPQAGTHLFTERGGAGEDDASAGLEVAQVQRDSSRDGQRADSDSAARRHIGAARVGAHGGDHKRGAGEDGGEELHGGEGGLEWTRVNSGMSFRVEQEREEQTDRHKQRAGIDWLIPCVLAIDIDLPVDPAPGSLDAASTAGDALPPLLQLLHVLGVHQDIVDLVRRTGQAVDRDIGDVDLAAGRAGVAALGLAIVAVDHNSVLHVRQRVARVRHVRHLARQVDNGLDADAVHTVNDLVVLHRQTRHRVRRADRRTADRTDGDTVATAAGVAGEDGVGAGLHSETVVLVVDLAAGNGDARVLAQVEAVRVLSEIVTIAGVEGRVLDREALDRRGDHLAHAEEHGARDGRTLLPVPRSLAI
ncbi:hypothetical protein ON010_g2098 [Phytophthora cinnamomi]|nr:hypothetical protein ON010_g2098 [Phytophthora cinnamomi]